MPRIESTSCETCAMQGATFWFTLGREGPNYQGNMVPAVRHPPFPTLYFCSLRCVGRYEPIARLSGRPD